MQEKLTVAQLREAVITKNVAVKDAKGVYRLPNGNIVSKATKAELENALYVDPVPTLHHKDGPITPTGTSDKAAQIARCYQKAGEFESQIHLHPRNRRRANYWTRQAKKLEREAA